jgi:hypothetical protein
MLLHTLPHTHTIIRMLAHMHTPWHAHMKACSHARARSLASCGCGATAIDNRTGGCARQDGLEPTPYARPRYVTVSVSKLDAAHANRCLA